MNQQRRDVIRIIIILLSIGTPIARAQPFPDTEGFKQNDIDDVPLLQNASITKTEPNNNGNYLDILTGICREGWVKGQVNDVTVCLKTNTELLPWSDARDTCRRDFSFLVKMEAPVRIESMNLEDYLKKKNINKIWTGLHEEGGYLVWDEISPHKVRAYNDPLEDELLQRRAWKWDIEPFDSDDIDDTEDFEFQEESHSTCGTLDVKTYSDHHIISKRAVKSITKDPKDIQTEDVLETEQIPTANSKEIENPPETNIRHSSHPAQKTLLRWIEQMNQHINGRGIVHNANDVKEYINNQRDRMGEKIENDHEFTTNLNEAIEPVKPTEKTDFSIQRNKQRESKIDESDRKLAPIRSEETLFQSLPTNLRDSKFKQGEVTPKSIPATPASLVSVPTRPTMAVFIPLPTDPASENITSLNGKENGSLTDPKVGLPIPTVSTPENITKTKINMYPEDDIDYDDLLLNEKKKISNQSSVVKPPLGTKFLKTTVVPTPPSINGGNISTSSSSRKTLNKIKDGAHTGSINITSENVSTSSSEEKIQKKNLNEFTKLSESMGGKKGNKTKKEEKMNEILESLVSSSEDEKSKEDSEEIDDPSEALHNMKSSEEDKQQHHKQINSKNETGEVFLGKAANNHIPPAIEIKKSEDRLEKDSLDSSKLSDERGQQVSETDELILTDEIKSESVEDPVVDTLANGRNSNDTDAESKEKNELQPEKTKNNTKEWGEKIGPKPVSINIGLEDSDDLKAYWEAMKPSTNENIENEATIIDSNGDSSEKIDQQENVGRNGKSNKDLKSTTLFNTKTDYDLTEPDGVPKTAENTEGISELNTHSNDISEEQTDEKGKKENSQEGDYTKEEILLNLPPPQIKLASKPKERIRKLKNLDHYTDAVNSTGKDEKTSSKTSNRNMGVAIPIMPTDDNDDSYLNEYIKAVRDTAPLSGTKSTEQLQTIKAQAKGIHTNVDRTNMKKTNITNKARSSSVSSDKSESSSSSIEKESDYSDSLSSESISFEDEEKDRDKKLSMNRKGRTKTSGSQSNASNQNNAPIKQANDKTGKKVKAVKENEESRFNEHKKQSNNKLKVRKPDEDPQSTSQKHDSNSDSEVSDVESESEEISDEGSSEEFESLEDTKEANDVSTTKHNKEGTQSSIKERKQSSSKISTSKSPENLESKSIISNEKVIETTRLPPKININAPPVGKNGIDGDDSQSEESKFDSEISPTTTQTSITVAVPFNTKKKNNELPKVPKSNNIGGIIIPTQSDILFGSMTEKSDSHENKMEPIDNDSSTASSNIKKAYVGAVENDHDSVPITKVQILREKSAKTMETVTASSEESKEENVHSSNLPPLTSSSHMDISSTQTEEVDNSDLLSVDREYESDGAKLALDIIDKNRIDSYSSDEESLENTSVRPTTISPEEEDYDTTSSGEDLSEEIKGRVSESSTHVSTPKSAKESSLVNKHDSDERDRESSAQIVKEAFPKGKVEPDENDDSLRSDITESHNNQRIHSSEEIDIPITKVNNSVVFTTNLKKDKTGLSNEIKTKLMKDRETKMQTINEISQKDSLWNGSIETASATTSIPLSTLPSYEKKIGNKEKDKDNHHSFESDISKESPILTNSSLPSMDGIKRESVRNDRLKNGLTENKNMENRDISNGNASENINRPQEMKNTTTEKSNMEMDIETEDSNENTESNSRESIESLDESLDSEEKSVHSSTDEGGSLDQNNKENQGELIELDLKGEKNRSFTESTDTTVSLESVERSKEADEVENVKTMQFAEDKSLQKSANDIKTNDKSTRESTEVVKEDDSSESKNDDDDQSMQSVEEVPNEFTSMEEKNAESSDGYKEFSSSNDKYNKQSMHSEDHRDDSSPESTPDVKNITSKVSLDKSTNVGSSENEVHEKSLKSIIEDNGSLLKPINDEKTYHNNSTESIEISEEVESSEDNHNDQALDSVIHKDDGSNNSTSQVNVDRESSKDSVEKSKEVESSEHKTDEQSLELVEHKNESSTNPTPQVDSVSKSSKDSLEISKDVESSADDPPKQYRSSDENKLARSNSYEVKDYYDENNELFNEPEDEAMYMKEVNRDKLERDKNYEIESSQEIPIVLEDIINIDDSREKTTIIHSDEAFRSLIEKMNNKSRDLMTEAASKDEVRHKEDQDLDSTGIVGGDISDDADMDPEDILAHEADLKAEANVNEALLPRFSNPRTMMKKNPKNGKASMSLSNCYLPRTSMCYTYPVTVDSTASTCDSGWVGHVYHKTCYRIMRNANTIPKMPYENAKSICAMEGGRIAQMKDGYGGRYLLMTLIKSIKEYSKELPPKDDIPPIWVSTGNNNPSCHVMTLSGPIAMGCNQSIAVAICEKNANEIDVQNAGNAQTPLDIKEFLISDKKVLECDLKTFATELPILWFKDGRLIDIKVKKRKESILPHLGGQPITPLPEPAETPVTSLELNTWLRKTLQTSMDQTVSDEIFQGSYWCEAWKTKPFVREKSKEIFVRFTDVITFVGKIRLPAIPYEERLLHNKIEKNLSPILNIMTDLKFINIIVFRKLQQEFPNLERILTFPGEISSNPPLQLSFNVYIRASKNYTIADEMPLYKSMRSRYQEILRDGNILTRLPRGTPIRLIRSLNIRSTVSCQQTTLRDYGTKLVANFFPAGINLNVSSIEVCENGEKAGRATCKGNFRTGAYWGNVHINQRCGTSDTIREEIEEELDELTDNEEPGEEYENLVERMSSEERLKELAEMEIEENNLESVMEETAEITDTVEELKEIDLEYINDIMEKSAISPGKSRFVAAKALQTVDRLLTMDDTVFEKAKRVSSIIQNFEKIVEDTELSDDGYFRLVLPNVAMEIYELEKYTQPVIGLAAKTDKQGNVLYTPFNQQRIITIYNDSAVYDDIDVAIHLPPELVQETRMENKSRLYMMVYREGNMFQDSSVPNNVGQRVSIIESQESKMLNSFVISASIGGKKIEGLKQKVKTIFRPLKDFSGRPRTCAFYNFTLNNMAGGWSSAGCVYDGQVNGRDVCLCDHLTNFAVLIDFYGQEDRVDRVHEVSLSIISLIGLSLSILGLSLTIISYVFFRKLRKGRAQQTLFNLALAMLCSWVIFLVGIKQTYHYIGCLIVAILLHYFIVASFMWMLMEAFLQYLTFVKVLGTYVNRYTLKSVIAAWGLPLIPIICVLSIDHNLYKGGDHYCWMSLDAFYYAFAVPIGVIILANLVIFVITVVSIFRRPQGLRSNQSKHKMAITNLQAAITSFVLLGLSWILGYFAISDARLLFQYAFTILNSLQGFFIFVLFVARKKQVREQWKMICCCIYPDQQKAQRTLSASTSYPSTCSSRSNSSTSTLHHQGRTDRSDSCKTTTSFIGTDYDSIYTVPYSRASRESLYYRKL